ncbi:MAG: GNAT family N-acetyltransferase [Actinomycetia bacterium]|nr:GNAT family N-acetyltransferase [Actinomycetes bacterium]
MADVFVREARLIDAAGFAAVQRHSWLDSAAALGLPAPPDADLMQRSWEKAVMAPPSDRHHTWVAVETSSDDEVVVGVAALSPASDPDLDADVCLELLVFTVDPPHRSKGHGSRLLTAALQTASAGGEGEAVVWLASGDDSLRRFLEAAGGATDGAHRTLAADDAELDADGAHELRQVRLGTILKGPELEPGAQ